jgi:glucose/arabinose dehydrogenase
MALPCSAAAATSVPARFAEETVLEGLTYPTAVSFAPRGRIFIAEKSGLIKQFSGPRDATAKVVADLRTEVHSFGDRGLLGMTIDPAFPKKPHIYALYTRDAPLGGKAPTWGTPRTDSDDCPTPPGSTQDGCVASGRLVRLTLGGKKRPRTKVLVDGWCQQYSSHSVGDLAFDSGGALYASGGEAAAWHMIDYGQDGSPLNPCGDPPAGVGGTQTPPTAEGGSLRAQDVRTQTDPTGLNGTVIRIDPRDGSALPDNPLASNPDPNARRIIAYGLRNPFRIAFRPGTGELWVGDVGANLFDEIDRVPAGLNNFGWPCYEGPSVQPDWDELNVDLCESLYADQAVSGDAVISPWFSYGTTSPVVAGDGCTVGQSALSGLAFSPRGRFPGSYKGALFFADYGRECIWVMRAGTDGLPDPTTVRPFLVGGAGPVDLEPGPGGLYFVDLINGELRRIRFTGANQPPHAQVSASRTSGALPLHVTFNASRSSDPERKRLRYSWDLDGDGRFGDSRRPRVRTTYRRARPLTAALRVIDRRGERDTDEVEIFPGDTPPELDVLRPSRELQWTADEVIRFAGSARDREDGVLPARAMNWEVVLRHCRVDGPCHTHPVQQFAGVRQGEFAAPAHEYPSFLKLLVTATDSDGLAVTQTIRLRQVPPQ